MEKLTDNTDYCTSWSDCEMPEGKCVFLKNCYDRKIYKKLKEYEDLEEQGLLLRLPCKLDSIVYKIKRDGSCEKSETIKHNGHYYYRDIDVFYMTQAMFEIEDIANLGETVFITKSEAKAALERMNEDE